MSPPTLFFFFLKLLWLLGVPCNAIRILFGTALEFVDSFVILTTLSLSTHDMKPISLYLGLPKFLSAKFCSLQCTSLSPTWLNLLLSCILFDAIVKGIVFSSSFLNYSLVVYIKTTGFCVWSLCNFAEFTICSRICVFLFFRILCIGSCNLQ